MEESDINELLQAFAKSIGYNLRGGWLTKDSDGNTPVHLAARYGRLNQVPQSVLTSKNMLIQNDVGWNVLHFATRYGSLAQLPQHVFTAENLLAKDNRHWTPLHAISTNGRDFNHLPHNLLTVANMMVGDKGGWTPLHACAKYGHLDQVPKLVLTVETLLLSDVDGDTPLSVAVENEHLVQVPLGLAFPESIRELVGDEWWCRNQVVLGEKDSLSEQADVPTEVDLF